MDYFESTPTPWSKKIDIFQSRSAKVIFHLVQEDDCDVTVVLQNGQKGSGIINGFSLNKNLNWTGWIVFGGGFNSTRLSQIEPITSAGLVKENPPIIGMSIHLRGPPNDFRI